MTTALILTSLVGLAYIAWTDPKRRRTHKLPLVERRLLLWPARAAVFAPGIFLVLISHWSGLAIWAGAITTLGWTMAAITPKGYATHASNLLGHVQVAWQRFTSMVRGLLSALGWFVPVVFRGFHLMRPQWAKGKTHSIQDVNVAKLEARIAALEKRIQDLESAKGADVLDAPDPKSVIHSIGRSSDKDTLDAAE